MSNEKWDDELGEIICGSCDNIVYTYFEHDKKKILHYVCLPFIYKTFITRRRKVTNLNPSEEETSGIITCLSCKDDNSRCGECTNDACPMCRENLDFFPREPLIIENILCKCPSLFLPVENSTWNKKMIEYIEKNYISPREKEILEFKF